MCSLNHVLIFLLSVLPSIVTTFGQQQGFGLEQQIVHQDCDTVMATFCEGEPYSFNNMIFQYPGIYTLADTSQTGCDSIVLILEEIPHTNGEAYFHFCLYDINPITGLPFEVVDTFNYFEVIQNQAGCDSIITILFVVHEDEYEEIYTEVEPGTIYHGVEITQDTQFIFSDTTEYGCNKVIVEYVTTISGILNVNNEQLVFTIAPNPFSSEIKIVSIFEKEMVIDFLLYNTFGELITAFENESFSRGNNELTLSLPDLIAGVYYMVMTSEDGNAIEMVMKSR